MKNKKRLLIRVCSILACVVLVAALAIPCFALEGNSSYLEVLHQYVVDLGYDMGAFEYIMSNMLLQNTTDDFNYWLTSLTACYMGAAPTNDNVYTDVRVAFASDPGTWDQMDDGTYACDFGYIMPNCSFSIVSTVEGRNVSIFKETCAVGFLGEFTWSGYDDDASYCSGQLIVANASLTEIYCVILCTGRSVDAGYGILPGVEYYSLNFILTTVLDPYYGQTMPIDAGSLFFAGKDDFIGMGDFFQGATDCPTPINVRSLITGWTYGTNVGGKGDYTQEDLNDAYNAGLQKGESNSFADGFLGESFGKIIEALNMMTIVSFPGGGSITILGLVSAVIALVLLIMFLKFFAGG